VNGVSEQDLELLEEYLDGALAPQDAEQLRARLTDEPDLVGTLAELRAERDSRAAVWAALEPGDGEASRLAARVSAAARRHERKSSLWQHARFASAAAACLMVGVFVGWLGRDRGLPPAGGPGARVNEFVDGPVTNVPPFGATLREVRYHAPGRRPQPMLIVSEVTPNSAAAGAGLQDGDLLVSLDGQAVRDFTSLQAAMNARTGTRVLRILRGNELLEATIQVR
jgi:hypothetical protein